jgi:hypothetical protein
MELGTGEGIIVLFAGNLVAVLYEAYMYCFVACSIRSAVKSGTIDCAAGQYCRFLWHRNGYCSVASAVGALKGVQHCESLEIFFIHEAPRDPASPVQSRSMLPDSGPVSQSGCAEYDISCHGECASLQNDIHINGTSYPSTRKPSYSRAARKQ